MNFLKKDIHGRDTIAIEDIEDFFNKAVEHEERIIKENKQLRLITEILSGLLIAVIASWLALSVSPWFLILLLVTLIPFKPKS